MKKWNNQSGKKKKRGNELLRKKINPYFLEKGQNCLWVVGYLLREGKEKILLFF